MAVTSPTVFVAGAGTLIGQALVRRLVADGRPVVGADAGAPDLTRGDEVDAFLARHRPEWIVHAGGRSGGIELNRRHPAQLMVDNLLAATHVIASAQRHGTRRLLYLASSCAYPRDAAQPMTESALLTGPLEPTSAPYAIAKLAGLALCDACRREHGLAFTGGIPGDAFGPGDDFSEEHSHVVAGLLRRMHAARVAGAREFVVWGSGTPRRELIYADDLADACLCVLARYDGPGPINLGSGDEVSIRELAGLVRETVGLQAELRFDTSRPDGMPRKALDSTTLRALGWRPRWPLRDALARTYQWFLRHGGAAAH
jgi:GDP-L-fucose synthase